MDLFHDDYATPPPARPRGPGDTLRERGEVIFDQGNGVKWDTPIRQELRRFYGRSGRYETAPIKPE